MTSYYTTFFYGYPKNCKLFFSGENILSKENRVLSEIQFVL